MGTTRRAASGRSPDLVFSGHVHNYQRFTRSDKGRDIPYIVAGAGGYWHLHYVAKDASGKPVQPGWKVPGLGVVLETYADSRHGFMRLEITPQAVHGDYMTVPRPQEAWRTGPTQTADSFTLNLRSHKLVSVQTSAKVGTTRRPPAHPGKRG